MFRNFRSVIPSEPSCSVLCEVQNDKLVAVNLNKNLPSSSDYSLSDLLAAGVKVAPVDTTIVHDNDSTIAVASSVVNSLNVESPKESE